MQASSFHTKAWLLGLCFAAAAFFLLPTDLFAAQAADVAKTAEVADAAEKSKVGKLLRREVRSYERKKVEE